MAAGATYEPIATTTLGSAASSISFSSISSAYTDLRLVLVTNGVTSGVNAFCRFNSDTASNYSFTGIYGIGSSAGSNKSTGSNGMQLDFYYALDTTIPNLITLDIFSYAGSTNKTTLITFSSDLNGLGSVERGVGLWRSTAAINTVLLYMTGQNFKTGTTATLYGILKA